MALGTGGLLLALVWAMDLVQQWGRYPYALNVVTDAANLVEVRLLSGASLGWAAVRTVLMAPLVIASLSALIGPGRLAVLRRTSLLTLASGALLTVWFSVLWSKPHFQGNVLLFGAQAQAELLALVQGMVLASALLLWTPARTARSGHD